MGFFDGIFGEKEKKQKVDDVSTLESEFLKAKKEIDLLEDKYDDFIIKSLETDFDDFKSKMDLNFPKFVENDCSWFISDFSYSEITLKKFQKNKFGNNDKVILKINYKFDESTTNFRLVFAHIIVNQVTTLKDDPKLLNILKNYFMYVKLKEVNKKLGDSKMGYKKMIDIIGKDVMRDSLIDEILSK